eukprot:maker-scaffold80_size398941-snap-gene-0.6 protein:Tk02815 transcript:maker-scaffold80_size398941-snap-gene-0.6-mRNA-1 annotation:"PREDICTED: deoxyribonuclease-2-alpha-like"
MGVEQELIHPIRGVFPPNGQRFSQVFHMMDTAGEREIGEDLEWNDIWENDRGQKGTLDAHQAKEVYRHIVGKGHMKYIHHFLPPDEAAYLELTKKRRQCSSLYHRFASHMEKEKIIGQTWSQTHHRRAMPTVRKLSPIEKELYTLSRISLRNRQQLALKVEHYPSKETRQRAEADVICLQHTIDLLETDGIGSLLDDDGNLDPVLERLILEEPGFKEIQSYQEHRQARLNPMLVLTGLFGCLLVFLIGLCFFHYGLPWQ